MNVRVCALPLCVYREERDLTILFKNLIVITGEQRKTLLGCAPWKEQEQQYKLYKENQKKKLGVERLLGKAMMGLLGHWHMEHVSQTSCSDCEENHIQSLGYWQLARAHDYHEGQDEFSQQKQQTPSIKAKPAASEPCRALYFTTGCSNWDKTKKSYKNYQLT